MPTTIIAEAEQRLAECEDLLAAAVEGLELGREMRAANQLDAAGLHRLERRLELARSDAEVAKSGVTLARRRQAEADEAAAQLTRRANRVIAEEATRAYLRAAERFRRALSVFTDELAQAEQAFGKRPWDSENPFCGFRGQAQGSGQAHPVWKLLKDSSAAVFERTQNAIAHTPPPSAGTAAIGQYPNPATVTTAEPAQEVTHV